MKRILLVLLIFSSYTIYSQAKVEELYEYKVNENLIKKDEKLKFWLDSLMSKVYYVGHEFSQSLHQEQSFHSFNLITKDTLLIKIPGTPLKLSFKTVAKKTRGKITQPLTVEYNIPFFSKTMSGFDPITFQYKASDYFLFGLKALRINDRELIANVLNRMIDDNYESKVSKFDLLINDINQTKKFSIPLLNEKEKDIAGVIRELNKVTKDIPMLIYEVYIDNKSEEKKWDNVQEFYNYFSQDIKKYLDDLINDYLVIKMDKPELLVFPTNWIMEKRDAQFLKKTANCLSFDRILFKKNQSEHCFEVTFEITNREQLQWCYGLSESFNAMKGKKVSVKASVKKPILVTPEQIKIYVYTNRIKGVLMGTQYEEIQLF
jgi:hypothetical protein